MIIKEFEAEKVVNDDIKGKRKINVLSEYFTKMRAFYRKVRAKHYAKKADKISENTSLYMSEEVQEAERQAALEKRDKHIEKYEDHKAKLAEMEKIKEEKALEKQAEKNLDALSDTGKDEVIPEKTEIENDAQTIIKDEVRSEASETEIEDNAKTILKDVEHTLASDIQQMQAEEPVVVDEKVDSENTSNVINKDMDAMIQRFEKYNTQFASDWESVMKSIALTVKNYNASVQKDSIETLINKQKELDEQRKENKNLMNDKEQLNRALENSYQEVESLKKTNAEKDNQIKALTSENQKKDKEIEEITSLYNNQLIQTNTYAEENAKLKSDAAAMSQQFKKMQEMFNNFQVMMGNTEQHVNSPANEEPIQKIK